MQSYKKSKIETTHNSPQLLTTNEIELLTAWREIALDRMSDDKRGRIERRETRREMDSLWIGEPAGRLATWRANVDATRAGRFVLTIGTGGTTAAGLAAAGWASWCDWLTYAGPTSWEPLYSVAREAGLSATIDAAADRIATNIKTGEDGGYKSAVYLLDWWRRSHGQAQEVQPTAATAGGGITYNIAIMGGNAQKLCGECVADIPQITATAVKQGISATNQEG